MVILEKPLRKLVMPSVHGGKIERSEARVKTQEGRSRRLTVHGSCAMSMPDEIRNLFFDGYGSTASQ